MYKVTYCIVGIAHITASIGLLQGSPISYLLLILYVNDLIRMIKHNYGWHCFLGRMHVRAVVDDTILLSTFRHTMIEKFETLNRFCSTHEMKIRIVKTNFFSFVVNGVNEDKQPILVDDVDGESCGRYILCLEIYCETLWCNGSALGSQPRGSGFDPRAKWKNLGVFFRYPHAPVHQAVSRYAASGKELSPRCRGR